jgi:glycogen debranching enzyme
MLELSEREKIREAWDIYKRHTLSNSIINSMVIRDDELTLVMQENGEIPITENYGYGLYYRDCRYLSGFLIRLMDMPPTRVLSSDVKGFKSTLMVTNPELKDCAGTMVPKETLLGTLATVIPGCLRHIHTIRNFNMFPVTLSLTFEFEADFADMFTIRGIAPPTAGEVLPTRFDGKNLYLSYEGEDKRRRNTIITFDPLPTRGSSSVM